MISSIVTFLSVSAIVLFLICVALTFFIVALDRLVIYRKKTWQSIRELAIRDLGMKLSNSAYCFNEDKNYAKLIRALGDCLNVYGELNIHDVRETIKVRMLKSPDYNDLKEV